MDEESGPDARFALNEMVRLRSNAASTGVVRGVQRTSSGYLYQIYFSKDDQRYVKEEDLLALAPDIGEDGEETGRIFGHGLDALRREVLLTKIRSPFGESLYSLHASRLEFHVYQFKPVLKFLSSPNQRLLIADEVGLGKTIEAGIILSELRARVDVDRVLIVVPSSLRQKWHDELRSRFDETFEILEAPRLRRFLADHDRHGDAVQLKGIVSSDLLRRAEYLTQLGEKQVHFDLVVIDEAHNCRNPGTRTHELATVLSENADALLLLTATPLHLGNQDLFYLMQILEPGDFDEFSNFEDRIRPNRILNEASRAISAGDPQRAGAALARLMGGEFAGRYAGNAYVEEAQELLHTVPFTTEEAVRCQRVLLDLNALAHVFTRTRKREVSTNAPIRDATVLKYRYSNEETRLYNGVIALARREWQAMGDAGPIGFTLVTRERQAASCLPAFAAKYLSRQRDLGPDPEELDLLSSVGGNEVGDTLSEMRPIPPALQEIARQLRDGIIADTKFTRLQNALKTILLEEPAAKVMIFSFFLDTLRYLRKRLQDLGPKVLHIDGSIGIDARLATIEEFRVTPEACILLSSEVGSEGLDFQFCHILFNYDLPWNPMKVEQRIGRIDRFGQKNPKVVILSLVAEDTIEDRILARLYHRINVFEETIGDLEAILGDEMSQLSRALYTTELTAAEQIELADRVATSILRRKQDLEEFDKHKMEFLGQDAIFEQDVNAAIASGRYVAPSELLSLVRTFMSDTSDRAGVDKNEGDETYVVVPDWGAVEHLKARMVGPEFSDEVSRRFRSRLRSMEGIPSTFSDDIAYERKCIEYINLNHPLCRVAIAHWLEHDRGEYPVLSATVESSRVAAGEFYVFLFALRIEALRSQEKLVPVAVNADTLTVDVELSRDFLSLIQEANGSLETHATHSSERQLQRAKERALGHIFGVRDRTEAEHRRRNSALVDMRLASLDQTYLSKKRLFSRYLETATEERIRRMRRAQIGNLEVRHNVERGKIEARRGVSVMVSLKMAAFLSISPPVRRAARKEVPHGNGALELTSGSFRPSKQTIYDKVCPHNVPKSQVCCICEPKRFREMTGID